VAPLLVALVALVGYPLIKLGYDSLTLGDGIGNYVTAVSGTAAQRSFLVTIGSSALVTAIAVIVGFWLSWYLVTTTKAWLRNLLWVSILVPFWLGTIVKNYAFVLLFARNGVINGLLVALGLEPVGLLYTPTAVVFGITYSLIPFATLAMYAVVSTINPSLVIAARGMGASRFGAMRQIALPLATPGFVASGSLVFALSIGFYITPVLLGGAQSPFVASVISANVLQYFNYPVACAQSVLLLLMAFVVIGAAYALVGRDRLVKALA